MANTPTAVAQEKGLGIRFQAIVPRQMILAPESGTPRRRLCGRHGHHAGTVRGRFGAPIHLARPAIEWCPWDDPQFDDGVVFGLNGDAGVTVMEGAAA